jgi:hypothetical protein
VIARRRAATGVACEGSCQDPEPKGGGESNSYSHGCGCNLWVQLDAAVRVCMPQALGMSFPVALHIRIASQFVRPSIIKKDVITVVS